MPTFKAVVLSHHIKPDGTAKLKIRVTQGDRSKYIDAGLTVTRADLNKKLQLKTRAFIDAAENKIRGYRDKCNKEAARVSRMDLDSLMTFLTTELEDLDFIKYSRAEIERIKAAGRTGVAKNYFTAINSLERYIGSDKLPVSHITVKFLREFEGFIRERPDSKNNKGMSRAPSLYLGIVRALHNRMKLEYNDEDAGVTPVSLSPFQRYKLPPEKTTRKRAISAESIKAILALPDKGERYTLARDCFALSFYLIGMNSADLFTCTDLKGDVLSYKRKKTRSRRKDEALIRIQIPPEAKPLLQKYRGKDRVFNFYTRYATELNFNAAINKGLKLIGTELGLEDLEYYAARHSWATIALNKAGIDKYTVHAALNHVDEKMRVTDIYIDEDWSPINKANRAVLDYIKKPPL